MLQPLAFLSMNDRRKVSGPFRSSWRDKETRNSFEINEKEAETSVEIKIENTGRKGEFRTTRNATDGEINIYEIKL